MASTLKIGLASALVGFVGVGAWAYFSGTPIPFLERADLPLVGLISLPNCSDPEVTEQLTTAIVRRGDAGMGIPGGMAAMGFEVAVTGQQELVEFRSRDARECTGTMTIRGEKGMPFAGPTSGPVDYTIHRTDQGYTVELL